MKKFIIPLFLLLFFGCERIDLDGEYSNLVGRYTWVSSAASNGVLFSDPKIINDSITGYTAAIEIDDLGNIYFFKDAALIKESRYTVLEKDKYDEHSAYLYLKLKDNQDFGYKEGRMSFRLSLDSLMDVDGYPFPNIDQTGNYFSGYEIPGINHFKKVE